MTGGWSITPEEQPEFDDIFAVALTLGIRNKKKKTEKVAKILDWALRRLSNNSKLGEKER